MDGGRREVEVHGTGADGRDPLPPPRPGPVTSRWHGMRTLVGLMLAGYGLLVLVGVLPHDALRAGALSLAMGALLLAWEATAWGGRPDADGVMPGGPGATATISATPAVPNNRRGLFDTVRSRMVALLGCACAAGVLGYSLARPNGLGGPELTLLAYGVLLMGAAVALDRSFPLGSARGRAGERRIRVATLVGWSFPLVLAPLALFALNAALSDGSAGAAAAPVVEALVVTPTAAALRLFGTPVEQVGSTLLLATPRGSLSLGVGLVCAGLYPSVLFAGLVGLHAWQNRLRPGAVAACLAAGLAGLWLLNLLRLVLLTHIGVRWGMGALQAAHANLGWLFFTAFMAVFWLVVLRRAQSRPSVTPSGPPPAAEPVAGASPQPPR